MYVNYAKGAKPNLAEVCGQWCDELRMLTVCVLQYSFMNIRGNHSLVYDAREGDEVEL